MEEENSKKRKKQGKKGGKKKKQKGSQEEGDSEDEEEEEEEEVRTLRHIHARVRVHTNPCGPNTQLHTRSRMCKQPRRDRPGQWPFNLPHYISTAQLQEEEDEEEEEEEEE